MKKFFMSLLFISIILLLVSCNNDKSSVVFKGNGENWNGELITSYNLAGEEKQSIKISYIGDKPKELKETSLFIDSTDFLGWGIEEIELDEQGDFNSGEAFKLDSKTPTTSKILLKIEGDKPETLTLTSNY